MRGNTGEATRAGATRAMSETINDLSLAEYFDSVFGSGDEPPHHFYAPGRVNLIGDHTDYNGGLVLPCGIERGIHLLIRRVTGNHAEFVSGNMPQRVKVDLSNPFVCDEKSWTKYPLGVFREFADRGCQLQGMQLFFYGNVPQGAGLSSSAAIEVVTAYALNSLYAMQLDNTELSLLSQRAENDFVGLQCGILDQFAIAFAQADHAIALRCSTLEYEQVPLDLDDYRLLISNTGQQHDHAADGYYNERVNECRLALEALQPATGAKQLADVSPQELRQHIDLLTDPLVRKRATHVIEESNRVMVATDFLKQNELQRFGHLMVDSHQSLKDDFQVSSSALDTMVTLTLAVEGVLGSRMTGGGFGGSTVTLIHKDAIEDMINAVSQDYTRSTGLSPEFYPTRAADGVREVLP